MSETEGNEIKSTFFSRTFKNKFKSNKLKLDSNKLFFYNNNNEHFNKKLHIYNYNHSSLYTIPE